MAPEPILRDPYADNIEDEIRALEAKVLFQRIIIVALSVALTAMLLF